MQHLQERPHACPTIHKSHTHKYPYMWCFEIEYGIHSIITYKRTLQHFSENVQIKFALRVCLRNGLNYQDFLKLSHLQSLQDRRSFHYSLTALLKIIHNIVYFPPDLLPPFLSSSGLRSNISGNRFKILFTRTNQYINSFICTVTQLWNNLPLEAINCTNFTLFKQLIYHLFS